MIQRYLFLLLSLSISAHLLAQDGPYCIQGRFAEEPYFAANEIVSVKGLTYGQAMRWPSSVVDTLKLDVYMPDPTIDPLAERPFIMLIHGGAFFAGQREDMASICESFARRGYVAATMSYRLGWDCDPNSGLLICFYCGPQADKLKVAAYRAVQDARAALRFMAGNAGQFGIDTSAFFIGGISAGSVAAVHAAFLKQEDVEDFCPECEPAVGLLDSGVNDIHSGYSLLGVLNDCGAVVNLDIFKNGLPLPMISFHDDGDCVVPSGFGYALGCLNCQEFFLAYGSTEMQKAANTAGSCFEMNLRLNSLNHCSYPETTLISRSSCFLKSILCGTCESVSSNDIYATGSCLALGGPTSVGVVQGVQPSVRLWPNPSNGDVMVELVGYPALETVRLQVTDGLGHIVVDRMVAPGVNQPVTGLCAGIYVVRTYRQSEVGSPQVLVVR